MAVELVGPPAHHSNSLFPKFRARIGTPDGIAFYMCQLCLDRVGIPFPVLIEQGSGGCSKTMAGHFVCAIAKAAQCSVERILPDLRPFRSDSGKHEASLGSKTVLLKQLARLS